MIFKSNNTSWALEDLQRKLSKEREAVQELDATCERLAGMERVCQELREENRRLEDEISCARNRVTSYPYVVKEFLVS
jgi:DNA repair exonuclease SbcCD ATPase subunit